MTDPYAGAISGLLGLLCGFAPSGMPGAAMLPLIVYRMENLKKNEK